MSKTIREAYGEALVECGRRNPNVVALDADVSGSTKSDLFAKAFPERFFNVGIAESNMVAMAAGLSTVGKIPFVNTFAVFLATNGLIAARELISYTGLNVKLMGAYGGLSDAFDGPTHHSIEDLAIMRTLPNMQVMCPCDQTQTAWMVNYAVDCDGPVYIRLSRDAMPAVYGDSARFEAGKAQIVREGGDVTVIACGIMVGHALAAAQTLGAKGISVRVVDMFTIKPVDGDMIARCAKETGAIVTAEEHSVIGGLGGAVAEELLRSGNAAAFGQVGIADTYAECGPYAQLLEKYGLDAAAIVRCVEQTVGRK